MTSDRLPPGADEPQQDEPQQDGLPPAVILAMCDRLLGEVGRRQHMFAWLRVPGAGTGEWLSVDAYYPRSRLVVMLRSAPGAHDALYRDLIPAHGLGLLTLNPVVLGSDPGAVETALAGKIFDLEHVPRATAKPAEPRRTSEPAEPRWTPVKVQRTAVAPALEQGVGVVVGLALAVVLIVEVYLAVVEVAFGAGRVMLGFAITLDACSRALGTLAAERAGRRAWACACAVGGAPIVLWFALSSRSEGLEAEPAPLAALLALLAGALALLALLTGN